MFLYNLTLSRPSGIQVGGVARGRRGRRAPLRGAPPLRCAAPAAAASGWGGPGAVPGGEAAAKAQGAGAAGRAAAGGRSRRPLGPAIGGRRPGRAPDAAPPRLHTPAPPSTAAAAAAAVRHLWQLLGAQGAGARRVARPHGRAAAPQRQRQARDRGQHRCLRHGARARGVPADRRVARLRHSGVGQRPHRHPRLPRREGRVRQGVRQGGRGGCWPAGARRRRGRPPQLQAVHL
jgi:hypothetical protein